MNIVDVQREHGEAKFLIQRPKLEAVDQAGAQSKLQQLTHFNKGLTLGLILLGGRAGLFARLVGLSVAEPGQVKQKQVCQLSVLEFEQDLREHLDEALDPDAQIAWLGRAVEECLVVELSVVLLLVSLNTKSESLSGKGTDSSSHSTTNMRKT